MSHPENPLRQTHHSHVLLEQITHLTLRFFFLTHLQPVLLFHCYRTHYVNHRGHVGEYDYHWKEEGTDLDDLGTVCRKWKTTDLKISLLYLLLAMNKLGSGFKINIDIDIL